MKLDWKKILGDTASIPDGTEVNIGGETYTIGDLRKYETETQGALSTQLQARQTELDTRENNQKAATQRLADIIEKVATRFGLTFDQIISGDPAAVAAAAQVRKEASAAGISANNGEIDWAKDPIYAPIAARYDRFGTEIEQDRNAMRAGLAVMQDDRLELQYLRFRLDQPELAKKIKYEDAVKRAVDSGYKDRYGFPDVSKALSELAAPLQNEHVTADREKTAEQRGYERGRAEAMGTVGQPAGSGTAGLEFVPTPDTKAGKVVSIADQLNKAIADPEILRTITGPVQ